MVVLLRALKALFPLLRLQPWLLSGMIILGVLAALSEGLSISLFIPLVQDQMGTQTAGAAGRFAELFQWIPSRAPTFVDRLQHFAVYGAEERFEL